MGLLYVFPAAAAIVVAAVWALGAVDSWWALVPAFLVFVIATEEVMRALARKLANEDDPEEQPEAPAPPRAPGQLLPH